MRLFNPDQPHIVTRAYCKLQKLLPLAKLISKYASWHLMPSVTEIRAKDPAGGLKFYLLILYLTITYQVWRFPWGAKSSLAAATATDSARIDSAQEMCQQWAPARHSQDNAAPAAPRWWRCIVIVLQILLAESTSRSSYISHLFLQSSSHRSH